LKFEREDFICNDVLIYMRNIKFLRVVLVKHCSQNLLVRQIVGVSRRNLY
jgi:hypothetical protein